MDETRPSSESKGAARWLLRTSTVLWVVWGLVHIFAGAITLKLIGEGKTAEAVHGITAKVELSTLQLEYPAALDALLSQHAFNLLWAGLVTTVAAPFVWRGHNLGIIIAALVGGLFDLGYFLFIDLGDFATPPGPQMTYICAAAIITGLIGGYRLGHRPTRAEAVATPAEAPAA